MGTKSTESIILVIMRFLVVIDGRKIESKPSMWMITSNTLAFELRICSPIFATSSMRPLNVFPGKASISISAFCPSVTLLMSISFTNVLLFIAERSGSVATTLSQALICEPIPTFCPSQLFL